MRSLPAVVIGFIFTISFFVFHKEGQHRLLDHTNWIKSDSDADSHLFIGFRSNWPLLQQTIVSYVASGWPAQHIIVVDNTGTMDSNAQGLLTSSNPSFLPHPELRRLGVQVTSTPTRLTFAQLQNYFLATAINRSWQHYFWSHQDVAVLPSTTSQSFYSAVLHCYNALTSSTQKSGVIFFAKEHIPSAIDSLAYVNVESLKDIGGWDTDIPYYATDWDTYSRMRMAGHPTADCNAGFMFDVAGAVENLDAFHNPHVDSGYLNETTLYHELQRLMSRKTVDFRNTWQYNQTGGQGEPFYQDPAAAFYVFDKTVKMGLKIFSEKWGGFKYDGSQGQSLDAAGLTLGDAWKAIPTGNPE
ncbi:hypothetical protein MMC16_000909 [Acarospora aff. strigata]|nr:hypothetical protein [Acarospora aff. strigata]